MHKSSILVLNWDTKKPPFQREYGIQEYPSKFCICCHVLRYWSVLCIIYQVIIVGTKQASNVTKCLSSTEETGIISWKHLLRVKERSEHPNECSQKMKDSLDNLLPLELPEKLMSPSICEHIVREKGSVCKFM